MDRTSSVLLVALPVSQTNTAYGQDFRVPESESMQAFTAAQLNGVPSRFLYFPDENHWVLSAQNGILWQREFFGWLERWLK